MLTLTPCGVADLAQKTGQRAEPATFQSFDDFALEVERIIVERFLSIFGPYIRVALKGQWINRLQGGSR